MILNTSATSCENPTAVFRLKHALFFFAGKMLAKIAGTFIFPRS